MLVDTSAWVEFLRGTGSAIDVALGEALASGADVTATEPVRMELLAGARNSSERDTIVRLMSSVSWTRVRPEADFDAAAGVYTRCRAKGFTPRGLVDCMIAAIAMRTGAPLLAADRDFARIAEVMPLRLVAAT